jgi:phage-related protein
MVQPLPPRKIELVFYRSASGKNEPVRDWLGELPEKDRKLIGQDLQRVQYRWPVGMPLVRPMGKGLFEVRTDLPNGRIARVLMCFQASEIYALHGFIKKARATPPAELKLARERKKEVENG